MAGIISYGAYVPLWRLSRDEISKGARGEKAVANFDEDSVTMAVAAAIDCLQSADRQRVDGLFFASSTAPYKEKQASTTVATAADLRKDALSADFANSLRAGTIALRSGLDAIKAGSAKQVMVTAADCRLGKPGSDFEQNNGDGAAALLLGDSGTIVEVEASQSLSNEIMDVWRAESDTFIRAWEDRFIFSEGYLHMAREAVSELMKKCHLTAQDFAKAVFYAPDPRRHAELGRSLGFDPNTQIQNPLFANMGNTGAAFPLMLLVAALEEAKPGDRILLVSYGDGSDAFVLQVTEEIEKNRNHRGIKAHLASKQMVPDYETYLRWKGLLTMETVRRPPISRISASAIWREQKGNIRFYGAKCKTCGTTQHPPQRVCTRCHTKDNFEDVRLSDKRGTIFTYSLDYLAGTMDSPLAVCVVNLEDGGRILCMMTDREIEKIEVGMPVEMSFRKLHFAEGIHNYYWKAIPVRT